MLKTISATLLAVSVLAAPAMAASSGKTTQAPASKAVQAKTSVLDANAKQTSAVNLKAKKTGTSANRSDKQTSALKPHQASKATIKRVAPAPKRG